MVVGVGKLPSHSRISREKTVDESDASDSVGFEDTENHLLNDFLDVVRVRRGYSGRFFRNPSDGFHTGRVTANIGPVTAEIREQWQNLKPLGNLKENIQKS